MSVIVPVFNDPGRLKKCLAALKASSFTDFEVIVADDGSTDQTPKVAESMGVQVVRLPRQSGAAAARNAAAEVAQGDILMFVDADVCVRPDTLAVAAATLDNPGICAVFGSYDLVPPEPNLLSQYKNLTHRFYHQESAERVSTFWTGCGAIRRDVFNRFKFDAERYPRPSIEDIDLGARITQAGGQIVINKDLQATHLKRWTFSGIIKSDLFDRAIPWTRLIHRNKDLPIDLNLNIGQRIAAFLTALSTAIFVVACWFKPWLLVAPVAVFGTIMLVDRWTQRYRLSTAIQAAMAAAIVGGFIAILWYGRWWAAAILLPLLPVLLINHRFYRYFFRHRGWLFAAVAVPMQVAYYLYSLFGFAAGTLLHWRDTPEQFDDARVRVRLYVMTAFALYFVSWALVIVRGYVRDATFDFAVSDAIGYYVYLPSLVIDGDLEFQNQLEVQQMKDPYFSRALRRNRWQAGVAMSIAPAFLAAHVTSIVAYRLTGLSSVEPHGYSLIYFAFCVAWIMGLGTLGMIVADRLVTERLGMRGRIVAAAVLTTWLGTNFAWYFTREPLMAHMAGASWVIFSIYLIHRIERDALRGQLVWWSLPLLAFTTAMALSCRLTNAYIAPVYVYLLIVLIRHGLAGRMLKFAPLIVVATLPLMIQWGIQNLIQGHAVVQDMQQLGYGKQERFYFTQPALLRTLFSSRHGLFFTMPALLLAAWGVLRHIVWPKTVRDPLVVTFGISALLLWYANSAWWAWWFGPSVGHRGFVELAGLYVIGFAFGYEWLAQLRPSRQRVIVALLVLGFIVNFALAGAKLVDLIEDNQTIIPWEKRVIQEMRF